MEKGTFVVLKQDFNFYGTLYRAGNVGEVLEYYPTDYFEDKVRLHMADGKNIVLYADYVEQI